MNAATAIDRCGHLPPPPPYAAEAASWTRRFCFALLQRPAAAALRSNAVLMARALHAANALECTCANAEPVQCPDIRMAAANTAERSAAHVSSPPAEPDTMPAEKTQAEVNVDAVTLEVALVSVLLDSDVSDTSANDTDGVNHAAAEASPGDEDKAGVQSHSAEGKEESTRVPSEESLHSLNATVVLESGSAGDATSGDQAEV